MSASTPQRLTTLGYHSFAHNPPTLHSNQHNRGVNFGSNPPAIGNNEYALQMLGLNNYSSSTSSQHIATTVDVHSIVPIQMEISGVVPWSPDSPSSRNPVSHDSPHNSPTSRDLGAWSGVSHTAVERAYWSPHASRTFGPISHNSLMSSQYNGMTGSDTHSVIPMMANPNAVSWTPGNLRTAISHSPSQNVLYLHDIGGMNPSFQLPPAQSELPINQPSPLLCRWVHNNAPCEYKGTLENLKRHWHNSHLPGCQGVEIRCQWEWCEYHKRGHPSINVMLRSSMWRHISEVHLMHRRENQLRCSLAYRDFDKSHGYNSPDFLQQHYY